MDDQLLKSKTEALIQTLEGLGSVLVAYSGGVDSTLLLAVARDALGERVLAVTARSPIHPSRETEDAAAFCLDAGIAHEMVDSREMNLSRFIANPPDRCYHCKKLLFEDLNKIAAEKGLRHIVHGANTDDLQDLRPGSLAAQEAGAIAPLIDAGLDKSAIRILSKRLGLPKWDRPPMACLATRIPYGTTITLQNLGMVEEAENFLIQRGFRGVRVRHHGSLAKIEARAEHLEELLKVNLREALIERFRAIGFSHVALDLEGYVSGKMNRGLPSQEREG